MTTESNKSFVVIQILQIDYDLFQAQNPQSNKALWGKVAVVGWDPVI